MASSTGNQNQTGPSFDMNKFFKPPSSSPINNTTTPAVTTPPPQQPQPNPNMTFPPPSSSSSYPPPSGPFTYGPQIPYNLQYHPHHHNNIPLYSQELQQPPPSVPINLHTQRSISYPTPPLQPPPSPSQYPPQNPNHGARLMALLSAPPPSTGHDLPPQYLIPPLPSGGSGGSDFMMPMNVAGFPIMPPNVNSAGVMRMQSTKLPKGRHLIGDRAVYDINVRLQGEVQPQLEVTPITKYQSDPQLVVGRQIAVNGNYICYGLKMGSIRVLNINTALRALLKGHTQRVSDMTFFAEDVHLLASASVDGRFYVWKISEGPDDEDKQQITGSVIIAIQIVGEESVTHPRVCWHSHKQEILIIGIGKHVLRMDTTKVGKGETYSAEDPIVCSIDKLIDGLQYVGNHDGEVTDLSISQWMTTRLVSASTDGTIKIWEDRKAQPLLVLRPHNGDPVSSAIFLTAPERPDHIVLITAGSLNRQVKFWASTSDEGWLLSSDAESWHCTQTLDLKSSGESRADEAFFNQVIALSQAGLLLFANAKKNAIYAVHIEYGPNPAATRMDYIAEFTVTMPILSFTGTSSLTSDGEHIVQVYCVQTQAIQQYALDLAQCLPPPLDYTGIENSDSIVPHEAANPQGSATLDSPRTPTIEEPSASSSKITPGADLSLSSVPSEATAAQELTSLNIELRSDARPPVSTDNDIACVSSTPTISPRLSGNLSSYRSVSTSYEQGPLGDHGGEQPVIEYTVDRQVDNSGANVSDVPSAADDSRNDDKNVSLDDITGAHNPMTVFKHPTHLITPSEILRAASSSDTTNATASKNRGEVNIQDVIVNSDMGNPEVEVKVVGEAGSAQISEAVARASPDIPVVQDREKVFESKVSDLGIDRECCAISAEAYKPEENQQVNVTELLSHAVNAAEVQGRDSTKHMLGKVVDSATSNSTVQQSPNSVMKGKKQKGKNTQLSGTSGPSSPSNSVFDSTDSLSEPGVSPSIPAIEASQILAIQESLHQVLTMQKEMQKQMSSIVTVPITKEGRRLEAALGRSMEKSVKANADAQCARFQEEISKIEKVVRDRLQHMINLLTNITSKDLPAMQDKMFKEVAAVAPAVAHLLSPVIEKSVPSAVTEAFQRGIGDKAVNQLERSVNSKLEASVGRQIQAQFQTTVKQALQDVLKSVLEASVVPAFEKSCQAMFEQVDVTFQKGMVEHINAAQQHLDSTHSGLALTLRDAMNSASSLAQTLSGELSEGQTKLLALAGANSTTVALASQLSNGPLGGLHEKVAAPIDPTKELSRLISEFKYEDAFTAALQRSDVNIVSWLCSQADLERILELSPIPLSQGVLLSLLQQIACDIHKDTPRKVSWMKAAAAAINPEDPMIAVHVRPIVEQVFQILQHHRSLMPDNMSTRLLMHVITSLLTSCK